MLEHCNLKGDGLGRQSELAKHYKHTCSQCRNNLANSGITSQPESSVLPEELIEEDGALFIKVSKRLDAAAAAKSLQSWDSPAKNTGVGCHFLLQCTHAC